MRVLHVCNDFAPSIGGIETFVRELAGSLRDLGARCSVLTLDRLRQTGAKLPPHALIDAIPVQRVPFLDLKYYKPAILPPDALRAADVIHVHAISALLDFVAVTRFWHRRPIVVSTHGGLFHTKKLEAVKKVHYRWWQPLVLRQTDRVVACSRSDEELFRPIYPEVRLIENGVDVRPFLAVAPTPRPPAQLVYLGRLAAAKHVDRLIETLAHLVPIVPDVRLRLVGTDLERQGPLLWQLAARLNVADRVDFVGAVPDDRLAPELSKGSLFLSASEYEGFGITAVQAMAAGCVPVLSDIPAHRALVEGGTAGVLTDFADAGRAAETITSLIRSDLTSLRTAAIDRARALGWERKAPQWMDLYRSLV